MQIVLLAGGRGRRLWPLSTDKIPKQFVKLSDDRKTMLSFTYGNVASLKCPIYVSTQSQYSDLVWEQTSPDIEIISEPFSNNTFAAFLNVAVYLRCKKNINLDETIAIIPTDHDVGRDFYEILSEAETMIQKNNINFCLIGIEPTYPSTQYGYVLYEENRVIHFEEKPVEEKAALLIERGAAWNSGVLVLKLRTLIEISKDYCTYNSYSEFIEKYKCLPNNSFDHEILESRDDIAMVLSNESWKDLGNWNLLYPIMSVKDVYNTNIINNEKKEIRNFGIKNSVIINTSDGLALYSKEVNTKTFRKWGYYAVLSLYNVDGLSVKIKYLKIFKGKNISYQRHHFRDEIWVITSGLGEIIINGKLKKVEKGDICMVRSMDKHSIKAMETLEIIEIQEGQKTEENDIERIEYEWKKISNT